MEHEIRIAGFIPASVSDGPGIRSVLFTQGCGQKCSGCHNKTLQDPKGGRCVQCSQLMEYLRVRCRNRKLTVSGGEPLEQQEVLLPLLAALKEDGFDLCLYTGFEAQKVPSEVLKYLHFLKTGPFMADKQYPPKPFVGSNNQMFYWVKHEKEGKICLVEI